LPTAKLTIFGPALPIVALLAIAQGSLRERSEANQQLPLTETSE
jgi:hypothetical protein